MTSDLTEDLAKMRKVAKEMDELRNPPAPQERNLEGLALVVMAVVWLIGAYAVAFVAALFGYFLATAGPDEWHWGTLFLVSYWLFFAGVVVAALVLAYNWAEGVLDRGHTSE